MDKWFRMVEETIYIDIKAVPWASKTEIVGIASHRLRIRIAAAPEDGKANAELISFLAKKTACPKRSIRLVSGEKGRLKTIQMPKEALESLISLVTQ